jgi:hypothetical protein
VGETQGRGPKISAGAVECRSSHAQGHPCSRQHAPPQEREWPHSRHSWAWQRVFHRR